MDLGGITRSLPLQNVFFEGSLCLIVVASLVLSIIIAIWVYRDAESRGMSGVLWLLVMLVGGLIGLLIYLIVRSDHPVRPPGYYPPGYPAYPAYPGYYPPAYPGSPPPGPATPSSSNPAEPAASATTVTCRNCGATATAGAGFCRQCGAKL